jgi:hypothetical protein
LSGTNAAHYPFSEVSDFIGDVIDELLGSILEEFLGAILAGEFAGSGLSSRTNYTLLGLSPSSAERGKKDGNVMDLLGETIAFLLAQLGRAISSEISTWFGSREPAKVEGKFVLSEPNVEAARSSSKRCECI